MGSAAVLGVDPGRAGGGSAVLAVNRGRIAVALAVLWTAKGELFSVRWVTRGPDNVVTLYVASVYGIAALGTAIGALAETAAEAWGADVLAVVSEGPYIGENAQTALSLARTGAAIEATAAARLSTGSRTVRTRTIAPTSWRKILGVSAPDRAAAKEKSLRFVPLLVDGVADVLAELGLVDHVTDAAGVAAVGVRCAAWDGEPAGWAARVTGSSGSKKKPKNAPKRPGRQS